MRSHSKRKPAGTLRAHKIRLKETALHRNYFTRCAGTERFSFNWALTCSDAYYREHHKTLSDYDLLKAWNVHRKAELPWTYEITKHAGDSGVAHFCEARSNWFRSLKGTSKKGHFRKPRYKSKHRSKKSFTLYAVQVEGTVLRIPKLGTVRMTGTLRFPGNIKAVTISEQGGHWHASFQIELSADYVYPHRCETQAVVGIDVGLNTLVTLSTGEKYENPKRYRTFARKKKRAQQALSRKQKGSKNRRKAKQRLAALCAKERDLRVNYLHQITCRIARQFRDVGIEDLNVAGMMKNHSLARALADASFGEISRQIRYKVDWAGGLVTVADRFYPSSKLCSVCGHKHEELSLSDRSWECSSCGTTHDRDVNAALNLESLARGSRERLNACIIDMPETA